MRVFGHDWKAVDEELIQELWCLEREGAIYTDHWQDHLDDFRHVKIAFAQQEIDEYVRSCWAYECFLRAGKPRRARDVAGIPNDIAERADAYVLHTDEGPKPDPPHHCLAGFIGEDLTALTCAPPADRYVILQEVGSEALFSTIKRAFDALTPVIRMFARRERGLTPWPVSCEDDVRDLLYAILRPSISDLRREDALPSTVGQHRFVDLSSHVARVLIEVKWLGTPRSWKRVLREINDDIQCYPSHPCCETIVFLIVDAVKDIPDPALVEREISGRQSIRGRDVRIHAFVREP